MEFKKSVLQDILWGEAGSIEENLIVDHDRWTVSYKLVFTHPDYPERFFLTYYRRGATELQDEAPWEYGPDPVECKEVFPVEKTITVYE